MAKTQVQNVTRLKPRSRWRLARWLLLLPALLVALHFGLGTIEKRKLGRLVEQYRRDGEPILPEDFDQPTIPDADNAAIDLRAAAATIDSARFREFGELDLQLPLSHEESAIIARAVADFSNAFPAVDSAM